MTATPEAEAVALAPQPGYQEAMLATDADIAIGGGSAGAGKTFGVLLETLRHTGNGKFGAVVFRRTLPNITNEGGLWDEAGDIYPHLGATPNLNRHVWSFPSGASIQFAHMQHEKNRLDWKGAQIPLICFDQLEEFTAKQFWYMLSRNRSTSGVRPYIRATCNPVPPDDQVGGWLHNLIGWWIDQDTGYPIPERSGVVRWFVRSGDDLVWGDSPEELRERFSHLPAEDVQPKSITFIPGTLADNPALTDADPGYRASLMAMPKVERERLLGGNWLVRAKAGDYFQRSYFTVVDAVPRNVTTTVRAWDLAATEKEREKDDPDWTVGLRVSRLGDGRFVVEHMERLRDTPGRVEAAVKNTADQDGSSVHVRVPQDPGQAGKAQARQYVSMLARNSVTTKPVTGSKTVRAGPASSQAEAGNILVVRGPWNEPFFRELENFPHGGHDDIVDALSDAIDELTAERRFRMMSV